ncbi:MAG: tyrosine-protein phosphatase [Fretibacterium sp.]|nr:tyrosine-protein phosphatase [Fretibacterium sp.]
MKKNFYNLLLSLFILIFCLSASLAAEAKSRSPRGAAYRRSFYRSLSKRLSRNRADYPHLTDEEFANFRVVTTTGMGRGTLYRSSSPVNPWGNRNHIADNAAQNAGIKTFVNLADTEEKLQRYKSFKSSYYRTQDIISLNLNWKYQSDVFQERLSEGIRLMAHSQPPFLIHCDLGKDRSGFVCAVLEALMGASAQEIVADYLVSFYNYFGIRPNTRDYNFVAHNEILSSLTIAFGIRDIFNDNLAAAAERYLLRIGVPDRDLASLCSTLEMELKPLEESDYGNLPQMNHGF